MSLFAPRKRGCCDRIQSPACIGAFFLLATSALFLYGLYSFLSASQLGRSHVVPQLNSRKHGLFTKDVVVEEAFAALFHSELAYRYKLTQRPDVALVKDLVATFKEMEAVGITTVIISSPWEWLEPAEGQLRAEYIDLLANSACNNTKLKVALVLDMVRAPDWLFLKFPDAKSMDSHGRQYHLMSWFHVEANKVALQTLRGVATYLSAVHPTCVTAVQPAYNNEYEAKYTQEHDCFQDYSHSALTLYRQWLQSHRPDLGSLNRRWDSKFKSWEEVRPPVLEAGSLMGLDLNPRFWDFIKFRELLGAEGLNAACAAVQAGGVRCFHHVPEFFNVLVAVYGVTMFKHIAASPHTDFLIVDSNFYTPYGAPVQPGKLRLFISAALSYGKPVYHAVTIQHQDQGPSTLDLLAAGFTEAVGAGARGVGLINWLPHLALNASLTAVLHPKPPPRCRVREVIGVFVHLDSGSAWHGIQWKAASKDPMHEFIQDLAARLPTSCDTVVAVFLELERFEAALPSLDRVIFVSPAVIVGDRDLELYARIRAALLAPRLRGRVELLPFPSNDSWGVQMAVLADLHEAAAAAKAGAVVVAAS